MNIKNYTKNVSLNLNEVHLRLKTSRVAAGYPTATGFCNQNNIPLSTYTMHETGKRKISAETAEKYAKLLQIDPSWLITGVGRPYVINANEDDNFTIQDCKDLLHFNHENPDNKESSFIAINSALFCKLFTDICSILNKTNRIFDLKKITNYVISLYTDITETSNKNEEQLIMANLALTLFKKQISNTL